MATNSFKISATVDGAAITFAAAITDLSISVFSTVGGLRTSSLSFGSDAIDGTNYGSNQWRKIIEDAGIRRMDVSGMASLQMTKTLKAFKTRLWITST